MENPERSPLERNEPGAPNGPDAWFHGQETRKERISDLPDKHTPSVLPRSEDEGDHLETRAKRDLMIGILLLGAGLGLTFASRHLLFYGAIFAGIFHLVRGGFRMTRSRVREIDEE